MPETKQLVNDRVGIQASFRVHALKQQFSSKEIILPARRNQATSRNIFDCHDAESAMTSTG